VVIAGLRILVCVLALASMFAWGLAASPYLVTNCHP
jgi:hypothetical protein